jgi:hypothetical protein
MGGLTERYVEERIREAVRTLRRLPEAKAQGYVCLWPAIKHDPVEILNMEKTPFRLGPPMPDEIDRMEEVLFVWLKWLEPDERRLVWLRAERVRWKVICGRIGCDRTTAWRRYRIALAKLAGNLDHYYSKQIG